MTHSRIDLSEWDDLKAANLLPCKLCGLTVELGQWIDIDGRHHACVEEVERA